MSQSNARWGIGATGPAGATGAQGPKGDPGTGSSGIALFQLNPINSPRFVGRYSAGSGIPQEMTPVQAATLLPVFTLTAAGTVPAPGSTSGRVLQDDGTWVAQTGGGTATGVTLAQQAVAGPFTLQGRFTLGTGTREDLAPGQAASLIGGRWGSGLQLLAAPTGGAQGRVLRDDGQWVQPSFVASGLDLSQLLPLSPLRILGRFTPGSGTAEQLQPGQVASMLPVFAGGTGAGMVPQPTGATPSGMFLRDDGKWAAPTGLGLAQIAQAPPFTLRGRNQVASGITEDISALAVASMLPLFTASGTQRGLVMFPTGGAAGAFLKDDGTWATPAGGGGGGGANNPGLPTGSVQFNQGSGIFAGSSGMLFDVGSGLTLTKPLSVASAVARFNGLTTELNASGISFGGVGGVGNAQFALLPPLSIKGRFTLGSGAAEDLSPGQVASMVQPFFGSGARGVVLGPTGGAAGNFLRDDGSWQAVSAGSTPTGLTNSQFAFSPPQTFKARFTLGTGAVEDISIGQAASLLPRFLGTGFGFVPQATGANGSQFLRDDGKWSLVTPSGVTNSQLNVMPPLTIKGNNSSTATGAVQDLTAQQVASLLGLVSVPTTAPQGFFLRDDGTFAAPTGVPLSQLANENPNTFLGRFSLGTGVTEQLSQGQAASLLPVFISPTGAGLVPKPSGATASGMFLRDDGKWSSPTGLGNGQFALMPPSTIKGTPGATGLPQDLVGSAVATLLPVFNNIDKGMVPGGGGGSTANFLRADGAWAAPSVGGAVSGVAFSQIQDISAPRFLGRLAGSGSITELTPLSAASMLPLYRGSGLGLVPAATGGASGAFLRDDGTWFPLLRNEIVGPSTTGFGTAAGSATIDFTQGEFHQRDMGGNTKFYLTPPSMMRHVQLRLKNLGSGYNPTFWGTAVKFVGGSGAIPSLFTRASGGISTWNAFWDGTQFTASAGTNIG